MSQTGRQTLSELIRAAARRQHLLHEPNSSPLLSVAFQPNPGVLAENAIRPKMVLDWTCAMLRLRILTLRPRTSLPHS
jgi:hypothetical protein